jgi:hypothetical protein
MSMHKIGVKLTTTDQEGRSFTSAPTFVEMIGAGEMNLMAVKISATLQFLESQGIIDGYSVVLKCDKCDKCDKCTDAGVNP